MEIQKRYQWPHQGVTMTIYSLNKYLVIYNMLGTGGKITNKNKTALVLMVFTLWSGT